MTTKELFIATMQAFMPLFVCSVMPRAERKKLAVSFSLTIRVTNEIAEEYFEIAPDYLDGAIQQYLEWFWHIKEDKPRWLPENAIRHAKY